LSGVPESTSEYDIAQHEAYTTFTIYNSAQPVKFLKILRAGWEGKDETVGRKTERRKA